MGAGTADGRNCSERATPACRRGLVLAQSLAARLGPRWVVRYWDGAYDTVKFVCWGCRRLHWSLDEHGTPSFPVRVTVEAEYKWYPLRADGFGDFAPDDSTAVMHLSEGLVADLYQWAKDFDTGMERYLRDRDDAADDVRRGELDLRGQELAERIARELGPARQVTYGVLPRYSVRRGRHGVEQHTGQGSFRRTVLATAGTVGLTAVSLSAALPSAEALPVQEASTPVSEGLSRRPGGWHRYVQGPSSRTVRPVRIVAASGDVTKPEALLEPGGARSVLRRPRPQRRRAGPTAPWPRPRRLTRATTATTGSRAPTTPPTRSTATRTPSGTTTRGGRSPTSLPSPCRRSRP